MFGIWTVVLLVGAYLLGAVPFGQLIAKAGGKDLTRQGSGNTGAANAYRSLGVRGGIAVLLADLLKGTLACLFAYVALLPSFAVPIAKAIFGLLAVLGHNYSIFRRFKGGKGIATTFGVVLAMSPRVAFLAGLIWVACVALTKYPEEKVGVFCKVAGKTEVVEYSDLPMELQQQRLVDGSLRFIAGSIAIHIISVAFIEKLGTDPGFTLPYHRAEKKIPCIDPATGNPITPTANNGVKLERFVFDALAMCDASDGRGSIVYETDRVEEFAPIKNASGVDSPETSRQLQTERAARWLERAGVKVPRGSDGKPACILEIKATTALEPEDLAGKPLPTNINAGASVVL